METRDILDFLQRDIHSTVMATVDDDGLPVTCVIDIMLADDAGLYFLTAKGKAFYDRLVSRGFLALTGLLGETTMTSVSINLRGRVRNIGPSRLPEIFEKNPYMAEIYPTEASRQALTVFQIYEASGEIFDLSHKPIFRQSFSYGGAESRSSGYRIDPASCIGCGKCVPVCPQDCIIGDIPKSIDESHCLHCGNCLSVCPVGAVIRDK